MKGLCFPWAAKFAPKHDCVVCHGIVTSPCSKPPHRYVHAWVEYKGLCLDWQTMVAGHGGPKFCGKGYPIATFYELFKPERVLRYSPEDTARHFVLFGHFGPWTEDFDDVIAEQLARIA